MKNIICETYEDLSIAAADIIVRQVTEKPDSVLGLATGSTPLGLYAELVRRSEAGAADFSRVRSFNLDEYYPIAKDHPQSYNYFMRENLFSKVPMAWSELPDGGTLDPLRECAEYDEKIKAAGGIDLQLLGIGLNGHIGFNEPAPAYSLATHLTELTPSTLAANSRFFKDGETQPASAITMGFGAIFGAKRILLLISGASKAAVAKKLFEGKIHTNVPASILLLHPDLTVISDKSCR